MTLAEHSGPARTGPSRLHPLTPMLRSARALAVIIAALSWQGYASLGVWRWALLVVVVLFGAFLLSVVSWLVTGYEVVGRELRVSEGLLFRRHRTIPLERLQAVDVVRPVLARLTGLAELKLEVIGAHKTEAPLSYLTVRQATALRDRLLALSATGAPATSEPVPPDERLVHAVDNRQLLVSQLVTPQAWLVPVAVAAVALPFLDRPVWTFVGVASMLTALAGVVLRPARRIVDDWHFQISTAPVGLRLRHGLLSTRSQTVPPRRIQAVGVSWPLLWRPMRWLAVRIDIAGYGGHDRQAENHVDRLLPVARPEVVRQVVGDVLDGLDVTALSLAPAPARARWLAPLRQPNLGVWLGDAVLATRDGWLTREVVVVPYARIQSVRVVQGPVRRALRLASVHVDTAGAMRAVLHDRDAIEAYTLAGEVSRRARLARSAGPAGSVRSAG